jgi:hypothetical protein
MSWHYSRALVAAYSAANSLDGAAFVLSKLIATHEDPCSPAKTMGALLRSRYGTTCEPSTADLGAALLTWFRGASRARTSASPAPAKELTASAAGSGGKWPASLAKWDRASCSWKTHQRSLLGDWEPFSETWPRWGMMRAGECWAQSTRAPRTNGSESGLWPTPRAQDREGLEAGKRRDSPGLGVVVRVPRLWPTPCAQDAKNSTLPPSQAERDSIPGYLLSSGEQPGGKLNPTWVEWLMGWPIGWTDCAVSATDRFRQWCASHGSSSGPALAAEQKGTEGAKHE